MMNEIGSFYEGPVPHDCVIRNNIIRNTQDVPIVIGSKNAAGIETYAKNITVSGNTVDGLRSACLRAACVDGLVLENNTFDVLSGAPAGVLPLTLGTVENLIEMGNKAQRKRLF